mmetsp:Transcript_6996/g.8650  ORF Transcript_6996/g.8650 Transcript_6996/m.8650 type:complete len:97 (-) Transcript_6996:140-430(-)
MPQASTVVDLRAVCFCHQTAVSIARVCSVCFGIFCEKSPICVTCGTATTQSAGENGVGGELVVAGDSDRVRGDADDSINPKRPRIASNTDAHAIKV